MATKKVNTATLIRGKVYTLRHPDHTPQNPVESLTFNLNEPVVIDDQRVLAMLEDLYVETEDGDGELYEKPYFRIDRGVAAPEPTNHRAPTRLSAHRTVKKAPTGPKRRKARH